MFIQIKQFVTLKEWEMSVTCQGLMRFGAPSYFQMVTKISELNCVKLCACSTTIFVLQRRKVLSFHVMLFCHYFHLQNLCSEITIHKGRDTSKFRLLSKRVRL